MIIENTDKYREKLTKKLHIGMARPDKLEALFNLADLWHADLEINEAGSYERIVRRLLAFGRMW